MHHKKLEDLPKKEPSSDTTRNKFDKLKNLYKELAPTKSMSINNLLDTITAHRAANSKLFATPRAQSIISKFAATIGFKTGTQKAYDAMEKIINKEIKQQTNPVKKSFDFSAFKERFKTKLEKKLETKEALNSDAAVNNTNKPNLS